MKLCEWCGTEPVLIGIHGNLLRFCSRKCRCSNNWGSKSSMEKGLQTKFKRFGSFQNSKKIVETKKANGTYEEHSRKMKEHFSNFTKEDWDKRKEKSIATNLERYGVEWNSQSPDMFKNQLRYKTFESISGRQFRLQGYESFVLDSLLEQYTEEEIRSGCSETPTVMYEFKGKRRRFYPDFFIPRENLLIEVKSPYIFNLRKEMNRAKETASKTEGYNFKFEIISPPKKNYEKDLKNLVRVG